MAASPPTFQDVLAAAERLKGLAVRTPLINHPVLDERTGGRILLKAENMQRVGAFKFRGAYNACAQVDRRAYPGGVVACSSGNHAQGVAHAATLLGLKSVIVMPSDAPKLKIKNTRAFGAEVVLYDRLRDDRVAIGRQIAESRGLVLVPPFDDHHVMAGQGTIGLEIAADMAGRGLGLDLVRAPCSGGGLAAGIATALAARSPATRVVAVEPAGFDDLVRSLGAGERLANVPGPASICDALMSDRPGALTFPVLQATGASAVAVEDAHTLAAMAHAFLEMKLVAEPGGAVGLGALLSGTVDARGKTVCVVLSGGNVDPAMFARALAA